MKKHSRIIFVMAACLAVCIGQSSALAASTNSAWNVTSVDTLSAAGRKIITTNSMSATFLSDGTFGLVAGTNDLTGTYTNTTKSLTLTFSTDSVAALESNVVNFILSDVSPELTVAIKSSKLSKISIKDGVPVKATDKVSGKASETVDGKTKSKSFSYTYLLIDWTLSSGTNFPGK